MSLFSRFFGSRQQPLPNDSSPPDPTLPAPAEDSVSTPALQSGETPPPNKAQAKDAVQASIGIDEALSRIQARAADTAVPPFRDYTRLPQDFAPFLSMAASFAQYEALCPDLMREPRYTALRDDVHSLQARYHRLLPNIAQMQKDEAALSAEIVAYTESIAVLEAKYRLSPDWNGKKRSMMLLGESLRARRDRILTEEAELQKALPPLYAAVQAVYRACRSIRTELPMPDEEGL